MKNCGTCKHWMKPEDACYRKELKLGRCNKIRLLFECYGGYDKEGKVEFKDKHKNDLAFTADASDYHAELITKAEFGCVQHEVAS